MRLLRNALIALVVGGGLGLATLALLARDIGGAAVLAGIALTASLAMKFLTVDPPQRKRGGFEPGRRG